MSGVRLADLELQALSKYARTFYSYKNVSVWSSPEALTKGGWGKKAAESSMTPESDVYSFGMLMWELWHQTVPFDDDVAICQKYVLIEDARPMISASKEDSEDSNCDEEMAKLIRLCWQTNPE